MGIQDLFSEFPYFLYQILDFQKIGVKLETLIMLFRHKTGVLFMHIFDLSGVWRLTGRQESGARARIFADGDICVNAVVPGNIELDLYRGGIIADPYVQMNAQQLRKYEFFEWCFTREFEYECKNVPTELVFEGLDCFAAVFVNGELAGTCADALVAQRFEVSKLLKNGKNSIAVHIASATNACRKYPYLAQSFSMLPLAYENIRARKPTHVWGWDIAPRMALGGIFRKVYLQEHAVFEFEGFMQLDHLDERAARITYTFKVDTLEYTFDDLLMTVDGKCQDSEFHAENPVWSPQGLMHFEAFSPKLWWPRNYGEQNLYDVTVRLRRKTTGELLAEKTFKFGIRELKLKALPIATKSPEPDFQFYINKQPVKILGTNHVPFDCLHSRDHERQDGFFEMVNDLNCNMVRVWGGGIFEDDSFYDRCDREGIMVWQDFMMACSRYPNDRDFCEVLEKESAEAVRRLRQHASIVLWCGDNECDCTLHYTTPNNPNNNVLTRKVLPEVCRLHDGGRPFLPSTPWCSEESVKQAAELNDYPLFQVPEQHLWGGMYFKDDYYSKTPASFFSEIGYFGCPSLASIKKFISPDSVNDSNSDEWKYHASNAFLGYTEGWSGRIQRMKDQISYLFGEVPEQIEDMILASQITQAEALKYFIEFIRSSAKRTGILWWNLLDCWPQFSDAVVDYYFNRKLAYHYIKRIQKNVLVQVFDSEVIISNYSNKQYSGEFRIYDADSDDVYANGTFEIEANGVLKMPQSIDCEEEQRMLLIEWTLCDGSKGCNHALCGKPYFNLVQYRKWLHKIAALDGSFEVDFIGK